MSLKELFQNSYFYLFLGCLGALGSFGITLMMAEKANSAYLPDGYSEIERRNGELFGDDSC